MKHFRTSLLVLAVLILPGCGLSDLISVSCGFMDDSDHCYQSAAVQGSEPDECAKIKGEGFSGSNPPRDKCYLQIAENTGDYNVCKKIEGGIMSYSEDECVTSIATKNSDPDGCKNLTSPAAEQCGAQVMKSSREALLVDVDDDDVKAEIVRQTLAVRDENPGMSLNDQLKKMAEVKEQQETIKRLDEAANTLMDQIKESASDFATTAVDDVYGEDIEKYKATMAAKGRQFLEEHGGNRMKEGIAQMESLKAKYDKASEQYEAINAKVEKLKKVYDEVSEVYNKVDEINKLVAEGKIDVGRAKVLHGAVYLSKGLEYATDYVPVFGSTISTISKETFNATIKFATSRASRTTAIDKCIDDPENCDPNGISPY